MTFLMEHILCECLYNEYWYLKKTKQYITKLYINSLIKIIKTLF